MDDAEFDRLLQSYMFGTATDDERRRLVAAALESSERALEFAEVDEIRQDFGNSAFRRSLAASLPDVERVGRVAGWRQLLQPTYLAALAAGAVAAIALLAFYDYSTRRPETVIVRTPDPQTSLPSTSPGVRVAPLPAPGSRANDGAPAFEPAAGNDLSAADLDALFALPADRALDLQLMLAGGPTYAGSDTVSATLTLPADARMYAVVRGPSGRMREVYPSDPASDEVVRAGNHAFSFIASGRFDPDEGGRSTLRVFVVAAADVPDAGRDRWQWVGEHANFQEVTYATVAR